MIEQIKHIDVNGKTYPLAFTINVLEEIQKKYGSYKKWGDLTGGKNKDEQGNEQEIDLEALIFGIKEMINEGIDIENENREKKEEFVSAKQVGRIITNLGLKEMANELHKVVIDSTKVEETRKNV